MLSNSRNKESTKVNINETDEDRKKMKIELKFSRLYSNVNLLAGRGSCLPEALHWTMVQRLGEF